MAEDPIYMNDDDDVDPVTESLQVRSHQMFLPGEAGGWTPMPHSLVDRLVKSAASGVPDRSAAVDAYVRKNVGRRDRGRYRLGIIDGLTISVVAQILACDRGNARRILAKVIQGLSGTRIGNGTFQFSGTPPPTPPDTPPSAPANTPHSAPGKHKGKGELNKSPTPGSTPPPTPSVTTLPTPLSTPAIALKPAPPGHPQGPQDYQDGQSLQDVQEEGNSSSSPRGRKGDPAGSPGEQEPEGVYVDKDGVEALRVEGMHSPNVERDIDLDGEEFVLLGAPIEGVPTEGQGQVPVTSPSDVPEVESWFIARWNEIADITGRPWLKVTTLTEDQLVVLASHPKALVSDALDYIKYNLWFRNPTMSLSSKTLFRPGKIAHYASLRDVDIEMAFSASAGPSQPPPAAQPSAQPPPPSTGPTPKAPAVAAAQDIPDELRPAWERLQAFQAQVKLPGKKLHGNGWTLLVENATAKVSAVDIAVRYEARITVCKAEGTDVQYWPSLKTFIDHGDHLLSPATVSTSIPSRSPSHRQEANADATEKRLAAFGQLTQPKPKE